MDNIEFIKSIDNRLIELGRSVKTISDKINDLTVAETEVMRLQDQIQRLEDKEDSMEKRLTKLENLLKWLSPVKGVILLIITLILTSWINHEVTSYLGGNNGGMSKQNGTTGE